MLQTWALTLVRKRGVQVAIGLVILVAAWVLAGEACLKSAAEVDEAETTVTSFLKALENGDIRGAYVYLSNEAKLEAGPTDFDDENLHAWARAAYSGFERLETSNWNSDFVSIGANRSIGLSGSVIFSSGSPREFNAVLVKESDVWRIESLVVEE